MTKSYFVLLHRRERRKFNAQSAMMVISGQRHKQKHTHIQTMNMAWSNILSLTCHARDNRSHNDYDSLCKALKTPTGKAMFIQHAETATLPNDSKNSTHSNEHRKKKKREEREKERELVRGCFLSFKFVAALMSYVVTLIILRSVWYHHCDKTDYNKMLVDSAITDVKIDEPCLWKDEEDTVSVSVCRRALEGFLQPCPWRQHGEDDGQTATTKRHTFSLVPTPSVAETSMGSW